MTENRVPVPTPQKQEFKLWGHPTGLAMMTCACGEFFKLNTLDEAVSKADKHEQEKHAIYELETE